MLEHDSEDGRILLVDPLCCLRLVGHYPQHPCSDADCRHNDGGDSSSMYKGESDSYLKDHR